MTSAYARFGEVIIDYEKLSDQDRNYISRLLETKQPDEIFNRIDLRYSPVVSVDELSEISKKAEFIYALYHFMNKEDIELSTNWRVYSTDLVNRICVCLRPIAGKWIWQQDNYVETKSRWRLQDEYRKAARNLLNALEEILEHLYPVFDSVDPQPIVEAIATYLLPEDPWALSESSRIAKSLIEMYTPVPFEQEDIGKKILAETLRPIFKSAKHKNVSSAGRFSSSREHDLRNGLDSDDESPWTVQRPEAASLLHFVLSSSDAKFMSDNWPLLVPSILAIIDDPDPVYKTRGCSMLHLLLSKANAQFILVTGIAGIFWDALMTCVAYLPLGSSNVTVTESVKLLDIAYTDLILLSSIRSQDTGSKNTSTSLVTKIDDREMQKQQSKYLGSIVMEGIYLGMRLCGEQVEIANLLMDKLGIIAKSMGIFFVIYLQKVIEILVKILSDPFGTAYPPLLHTTLSTLNVVMESAAPRLTAYRFMILKGLVFCWRQTCANDISEEMLSLKDHLRATTTNLAVIVNKQVGGCEWDKTVREVVKLDENLDMLFH
ncbi:hypothetical protein V1517DRAFT_321248 [Lipomyces orientalis]|uniref:Uncharacterized protein n=1 Tax=Lipomyces orientalis TaxID=1233043 RepID=A0ACC3TPU9_9ASCO